MTLECSLQPGDLAEMAGFKMGERTLEAFFQVASQQERAKLLENALLEIYCAPNKGERVAKGMAAALVAVIEAGLFHELNRRR